MTTAAERIGRIMGLQAEEGRGIRLMAALFAILNALFAFVIFTTLPAEGLFPGIIWVFVGVVLAGISFQRTIQHRMYEWMGTTFAVFTPVVWYIILMFVVGIGDAILPHPLLWSALQTWGATIFFWLGTYWLARYTARTVTLDNQRRRDWRFLIAIATLMGFASMFMPGITVNTVVIPYGFEIDRWLLIRRGLPADAPGNILEYITYYNTDVPMFINVSNKFPFGWRDPDLRTWQRPTFFMVSSQLCRLLEIPLEGYANGSPTCKGALSGALAYWIINLGIAYFAAIIVYEMVRAYYNSPRAARMAGMLTVVTGLTLFLFPIVSTDYLEIFIALASLWLIHRLFLVPRASAGQIMTYGIMFGLFLLLKLNGIFVLLGLLLAIGTQRWRLIPVFTLIPLLVFGAYRLVLALAGIPFVVIETGSQWPTINWITTTFLHDYSLFQKARAITLWSGLTFDKVLYMYGALLFVGVLVMIHNPRYPRKLMTVAWVQFFCIAAFALVFQFSYVQHTLGLMPFIYGAVAVGAENASEQVRAAYGERQYGFRARFVARIVWLLPLIHNVVQIFAWGAKDWINY